MKKYKASDLSHKRAEVMKEARDGGVIIQECRTNGEVLQEYVICTNDRLISFPAVDDNGRESMLTALVVSLDEIGEG